MANRHLYNPSTGERLEVLKTSEQTSGALLELESTWTRRGHRAPEHRHPEQEESFTVLMGTAFFRVAGQLHELRVGDTLVIPPGAPHIGWNPTDDEVRLRIQFRPALRWLEFVEQLFSLATEDSADYRVRLAALMRRFEREIAVEDVQGPGPGVIAD